MHPINRRAFVATALAAPAAATGLAEYRPPSAIGLGFGTYGMKSLDTAEATADTTALWTAQWLERILILVLDADLGAPRPSWSAIVDLHPAADGRAPDAPELAFASCRRSLQLPWPVVRRRCAEGNVTIAGIDALDAAWMDDGMFSRFALDSYVPTPVVLDDLRELLPRATAERVRRTVELSVNR